MGMIDLGVTRVPLSQGRWIDARNQLTARERKRSVAVAFKNQSYDQRGAATVHDIEALADAPFYRAAIWITGWNLQDGDAPLPYSNEWDIARRVDVLGALPEEWFDEIDDALETHVAAMQAARKNATSATASS